MASDRKIGTSYFRCCLTRLALGQEVWRVLAKGHQIRNGAEYEGELDIDERLVADLIAACQAVADRLEVLERER